MTADKTLIACSTNYYRPTCEYRLVSVPYYRVGVATYHVILLQTSNLSLVRRYSGIGFCPEQANVQVVFAESGKLVADDVS